MPLLKTDEEEAADIEAEAEYWRNYDKSKGNCLFSFIGLAMVLGTAIWAVIV